MSLMLVLWKVEDRNFGYLSNSKNILNLLISGIEEKVIKGWASNMSKRA